MRVENSFIGVAGVGEKTERGLWRSGVTHWDDFYADAVGPTTAERVETFIEEGRDRLDAADVAFFDRAFPSTENWRLWESFAERACCFDIETTGLDQHRDVVTTVSYAQDGDVETLVRGDDLTADALEAMVEDAGMLVTFNGKRFDVPFLETTFDCSLDAPHIDLMYPCKQIGLSGGLKQIERDVGIERDRPDISGRDAVRLWREYERGSADALETLVEYNRADTVNLRTLMDDVAGSLHEETFVQG